MFIHKNAADKSVSQKFFPKEAQKGFLKMFT
jgi:hypothetical protein